MDSILSPASEQPTVRQRIVHLSATLFLLFALTYLTTAASPPYLGAARITILIGFVLLVANLAGGLAKSTGLPRLTGFLLVGIVAGPSALGIVSQQSVADLRLIDEFALALIAMLAGRELKIGELRPHAKAIGLTTLTVTGIVWIGVAGAVVALRPLLPFLADLPMAATIGVALVLGIWAANSSPDLTVAVIVKDVFVTWLGARYGTKIAGASGVIRSRTWQGLISQGGVTLGLVLLIQERSPSHGQGIVALGMAVIVGNILGGPIILKQALAGASGEPSEDASAGPGDGEG